MPIESRCSSCHAALPHGAAWCSLCHADLRPERTPVEEPDPASAVEDSADGLGVPRDRAGRHARPQGAGGTVVERPPAGATTGAGGRHSRGTVAILDTSDVAAPRPGEVDDVETYAEVMLTRLAIADPPPRLADPGQFPGGRWGLAAAGMLALTLVLLAVAAISGIVMG